MLYEAIANTSAIYTGAQKSLATHVLSLKILLKLIYLDNAQYFTEHLTAAQLRVSTALYTKAIRAAVINSFKVYFHKILFYLFLP